LLFLLKTWRVSEKVAGEKGQAAIYFLPTKIYVMLSKPILLT